MQPPASELEQIVRVVMQRLAVGRDLMAGVAEMAESPTDPTELIIDDRVVSTRLVEDRLDGKRTLRVRAHAVVTPSVADLLRAKKIELLRDSQTSSRRSTSSDASPGPARSTKLGATQANPTKPGAVKSGAVKPSAVKSGAVKSGAGSVNVSSTAIGVSDGSTAMDAPVLVCGSAVWFNSLIRHLCPKQADVQACDDLAALVLVERHLSHGGKQAVWLSSTPFAAAATAQRSASPVAVQLPSLIELPAALEQAQPELLIIDASRWTVAAVGNLVRTLARIY